MATETDLDMAVAAAKAAFKPWSTLHRDERSKLLIQFADELAAHKDQFIELVYRETGKPVRDLAKARQFQVSSILTATLEGIC